MTDTLERAIARFRPRPASADAFWREIELAHVAYRLNQTMNFVVPPSEGHDDYVMSLALAVEAARGLDLRPRVARGRPAAAALV